MRYLISVDAINANAPYHVDIDAKSGALGFVTIDCMANVSAAYHTLLSTCRINILSAIGIFKEIVPW